MAYYGIKMFYNSLHKWNHLSNCIKKIKHHWNMYNGNFVKGKGKKYRKEDMYKKFVLLLIAYKIDFPVFHLYTQDRILNNLSKFLLVHTNCL